LAYGEVCHTQVIYHITNGYQNACVKTEIRDHGVGFFEFSKDEETRQQQLEALKKLRQQVVNIY